MGLSGKKIKHYEIEKLLGKGGMGEVYLAQDTKLDRKVAIKFLPPELESDELTQRRFIREAKAAAALDHPFICKVYESGEADGKAYIVMEYLEGQTLRERMETKPLVMSESLKIALEIAEALEKAHKEGIIHRDLKPPNIMITPQDHVKVMDFGLAKKILPSGSNLEQTLTQGSITEKGTIAGTLAYMSPEQAKGKNLDGRSDIFSLGIIIYEMFSHKHPFSKTTPIETLSAILRDPPPTPNVKPKMINPILRPILNKAMAKKADDRYQKISELVSDLKKAQRHSQGGTRLLFRPLPLIAASVIIIGLLVFAVLRFTRQPKGGTPETGPEIISVLIADFQNQTGDPIFDGTLEHVLGIGLEGAPFISIYKRAEALELLNKHDPEAGVRLNSKNAQLFSQKEGINLVVSGWIASSTDGYAITVWTMDIVKSERIAEADETIKSKADVLIAVQNLANKLIPQIGDISPESLKTLSRETFTASSLEAMKLYSQAQDLAALARDEEAIPLYLDAINKDPNLGRAHAGLAVVYRNRRKYDEADKHYNSAMSLLGQMTEREKFRTRGGYYFLNKNYKQAIQEYGALKEQFPADSAGDTNLPLAYFYRRDMQKAFEVGQYAVDRHPGRMTPWINLVWYAMAIGKFDKAEQEVHKILEDDPKFADAYVCLALIELEQGRSNKAAETYQTLAPIGEYEASWALSGLADIALYEGRLNDAKDILEKGIPEDLKTGDKFSAAQKYTMLAHTFLLQGKKALSVDAADRAVEACNNDSSILFAAARIYVDTEEEEKARNLVQALKDLIQSEPQAYAKLIEGELLLTKANTAEAIRLFQEAQSFVDTWLGHVALGRAYLESELYIEAHSEFELCLKRYGETPAVFLNDLPTFFYYPPIHYYLGRVQEALGSDDAAESYERFLKIKEKADEGIPLVEDCQRRLAGR